MPTVTEGTPQAHDRFHLGDAVRAGLANWKTTAVGAGGSAVIYSEGVGLQLPQTKPEWMSFALAIVVFLLGLLSKDATTGSRP